MISAIKDFNLSSHYNAYHKYDKYTGAARANLKSKVNKQRLFTRATTTKESALKASYAVSFERAKARKPFSDGEIVKVFTVE